MTAIADEHGQYCLLLRNRYEYGVLVRQDYANGDVHDYAYLRSPTRTHADKVRVTLPDRSVGEIWSRMRSQKISERNRIWVISNNL